MTTPEPTPEERIIQEIDRITKPKADLADEDERIVLAREADRIIGTEGSDELTADELAVADWIDRQRSK